MCTCVQQTYLHFLLSSDVNSCCSILPHWLLPSKKVFLSISVSFLCHLDFTCLSPLAAPVGVRVQTKSLCERERVLKLPVTLCMCVFGSFGCLHSPTGGLHNMTASVCDLQKSLFLTPHFLHPSLTSLFSFFLCGGGGWGCHRGSVYKWS